MQSITRNLTMLLVVCLVVPALAAVAPTAASAESSATKPPAPSILRAEQEPGYVNVVWRPDSRIRGVNIYRRGEFLGSVNSPNTVYNDFRGYVGASYELVAYGYDTTELSDKAFAIARNDGLDPVSSLNFYPDEDRNRVQLGWVRGNNPNSVTGWMVYKNNEPGRFVRERNDFFDYEPDSAFTYHIEPVRGNQRGPRVSILGPAVDEYVDRSVTLRNGTPRVRPWPGDNRPPVEGLPATNARTRSLAAQAERSSAEAQREHRDFEIARIGLAQSFVGGVNPRSWPGIATAGVQTREERMEAEAANRKAFDDLKAYEDCMASSCGRPPSGSGNSGQRSDNDSNGTNDTDSGGGWDSQVGNEFA